MKKKSEPPPPEPEVQVLSYALSSGPASVLPNENISDLQQIQKELSDEFQPAAPSEKFFVDNMVHARWQAIRFRRLQDRYYRDYIEQHDCDDELLEAYDAGNTLFDKLERLATAAERGFERALRQLMQFRAAKLRAAAQQAKLQNEPKPPSPRVEKNRARREADAWLEAELEKIQNEANPFSGPWYSRVVRPSDVRDGKPDTPETP